jgi:hypothetical protein
VRPDIAEHIDSSSGSPKSRNRSAASDAAQHVREKRGGALGKCAGSPFRECRGGEALEFKASSYDPFDQINYAADTGPLGGMSEGWVREALRRLDRNEAADLSDAVRHLRTDANTRRDHVGSDLLSRVRTLQASDNRLTLRQYSVGIQNRLTSGPAGRGADIATMFRGMQARLGAGDIAHVVLRAYSPNTDEGGYGHALLVQRLTGDRYVVFDPNNGAFNYPNRRSMETALRMYMQDAFQEGGLQLRPDRIQYYQFPTTARRPGLQPAGREAPLPLPLREPSIEAADNSDALLRSVYQRSAETSNGLSSTTLSAAAGQRNAVSNAQQGLAMYALQDVAQHGASNLTDATERLRRRLADNAQRPSSLGDVGVLQQQNQYGLVGSLTGHRRHQGESGIRSAADLGADLQHQFEHLYVDQDSSFGYQTNLAVVTLGTRGQQTGAAGSAGASAGARTNDVSIVIQRLRESADVRADRYELYDPQAGVFRYANFADLQSALQGIFDTGYQQLGGVDHADTTYYADTASALPIAAAGNSTAPLARPSFASLGLSEIERRLGAVGARVTPRPDLPPPPVTIEPPAFRSDLKRSVTNSIDTAPKGLFRPSTLTPQQLKEHGGFDCERTNVSDVNLALHERDVASNSRLNDSSGYLATFRDERTALRRMPGESGNGYIYYVAPTPNMVDVAGSLGTHAKQPSNGEVAAMGWIDYPQIRGWRVIEHGKPGKYFPNPDYRWDVYDQTRTAGAQLSLSRFPIDSSAWREAGYKAFVTQDANSGGATRFRENPDLTHVLFYDSAWDKVRALNGRQAAWLDYRGPLRIHAYEIGDGTNTQIYVDGRNNVYVNTQYAPSSARADTKHDFALADDGRFHLIGNYEKVLRVGWDGYVYLGDTPIDDNSLNGVFEHTGHHLIHQEDGKYLTTGRSSYTPFVDAVNRGGRSDWHLHTSAGKEVIVPQVNAHTFRGSTAGSAAQLYAFFKDPDSALPPVATHFVTKVPNNSYSGNFLGYPDRITPAEARSAADWLRGQNAAWLFDDGFYAVADAPDVLEVRKLDGTPVWRAEGLNAGWGEVKFNQLGALSSNYRIPDEVRQRVEHREESRARALAALPQSA